LGAPEYYVLLVDDDASLLETMKEILEGRGYCVDTSQTASDALKKFKERYYDVVVIDMVLPDKPGTELLRELETSRIPRVRKIVLTGHASLENAAHSLNGEDAFEQLYRIVTKDGRIRWVRDYTWARRDDSNRVTHYQGIILDVTDEVLAKEILKEYASNLEKIVYERTKSLREAERMAAIGETALMVGHDLRNPLQVIVNLAHIMRENVRSAGIDQAVRAKIERDLDTLVNQAEYMNKIVSDLADFSRPLEPKAERIYLPAFLEALTRDAKIPEGVDVSISVERGAEEIRSDPSMLRRVIVNLVTNAVQAMPSGGSMRIAARPAQGGVAIAVSDTGIGIPPEIRESLFKPFVTGKAKGMGLGLSVVKRFVDQLGGEISFESEVGKGSIFTVWLPGSDQTPV